MHKDDEEEELADRVFEQAYIPRRLEEVEEYERDHDRLAGEFMVTSACCMALIKTLLPVSSGECVNDHCKIFTVLPAHMHVIVLLCARLSHHSQSGHSHHFSGG